MGADFTYLKKNKQMFALGSTENRGLGTQFRDLYFLQPDNNLPVGNA